MTFTNRNTPPTDADFACPPGIIPGRRLPDDHYMDEDALEIIPIKTIIAGCRDCFDPAGVAKAMEDCGWMPTEVVSGKARGVDTLGEEWAKARGIPIKDFPAD